MMLYYAIMNTISAIILAMVIFVVTCTVFLTACVAKDPIIGVWRFNDKINDIDVKIQFKDGGYFTMAVEDLNTGESSLDFGTWSKQGENLYLLHYDSSQGDYEDSIYIYDPSKNLIYDREYPDDVLYQYQGDILN